MQEMTFGIIKPDAVSAGHTGAIIDRIEREGFTIVGMEKRQLGKAEVEQFYAVHSERPFFAGMVEDMSASPVVLLALKKENAIKAWRDLMGATNPTEAADNTLRKEFGTDIGANATHGSDAPETAAVELGQFFPGL